MSTMMDERTDERLHVTDDGDHDKFAHYVTKEDLERAIFEGVAIILPCVARSGVLRAITRSILCALSARRSTNLSRPESE